MMHVEDISYEKELWDDDPLIKPNGKGIYVAISGNTGAGKSSLIRAIVRLAKEHNQPILGISERSLHHPYLRLMFAQPEDFAFPIQLNFMLQRNMVLLRHLLLGKTVVIERSHYDDELFVKEPFNEGKISREQYDAYQIMAKVLNSQIPPPDLMLLLTIEPSVSIERLNNSEKRGDRPKEFPNDDAKMEWVKRWYRLYAAFHAELHQRAKSDPALQNTILLEKDAQCATDTLASEIFGLIQERQRYV